MDWGVVAIAPADFENHIYFDGSGDSAYREASIQQSSDDRNMTFAT